LGGGERSDECDLPDAQRPVLEYEAGDVADAPESEPCAGGAVKACGDSLERCGRPADQEATSITHGTTDAGSISRLEREEHTAETAHAAAAPKPPRIAII